MRQRTTVMKPLHVATVAMTPDLDPQISRDRMKQIIEQTKREHPEVRLILFGETILGWFYNKDETREYHESIAETVPGHSTAFIADLARTHDVFVSFGLSEKADGKLYNTQVLISPAGEVLAKHRKFWIRNKIFTPGDKKLVTADVDGVKVAVLICADARSLALMRAIRRERVDLVLASLADYATSRKVNQLMGAFYDAWTLVANRYGQEGSILWRGLVTITDPWARLRASGMDKSQVLVHRLDIGNTPALLRWMRRLCVGFKFAGMATVLTIQLIWASMQKKLR
ncbi:carbon-nitrogen hydrolase family protein, partial [Candidatus Bipolaricaulota bacterium]|nr:carbon-nitrogen hydrolase family protein [Candidatus Bipolaricaulota bacterium]